MIEPEIDVQLQKARTQCSRFERTLSCGLTIQPGDSYIVLVQIVDGEFQWWTSCAHCWYGIGHEDVKESLSPALTLVT